MGWRQEIDELQAFFESYYLGHETSLARVEVAFHPDFTLAGPNGQSANRAEVMDMLKEGHAHTSALTITTSDHQLLFDSDGVMVTSHVERHEFSEGHNERLCTVIFVADDNAPNGVQWLRAHESWITRQPPQDNG